MVNHLQEPAPSLDEMVHSTVSPILDSMAMGENVLDSSKRDPQRWWQRTLLLFHCCSCCRQAAWPCSRSLTAYGASCDDMRQLE